MELHSKTPYGYILIYLFNVFYYKCILVNFYYMIAIYKKIFFILQSICHIYLEMYFLNVSYD